MNVTFYEINFGGLTSQLDDIPLSTHNLVKREEGTPRSCSDPLSFASFLAFALAVANLMMGQGKRRKRSVSCDNNAKKQLTVAVAEVYQVVMASEDIRTRECKQLAYCHLGRRLSTYGKTGQIIGQGTSLIDEEVYQYIKVSIGDLILNVV